MSPLRRFISLFAMIAACASRSFGQNADVEFFERKIRPVLAEHCFKCHSEKAEKLKGGLRLDTREKMLAGGDTGPSVIPGDPEKSLLMKAIRYQDPDLQMPPKYRLDASVISDISNWISKGAIFPGPATTDAAPVQKAGIDFAAARTQWAFRKPALPSMPRVKQTDWVKNDIDRFILSRLEEKNLKPAPAAGKQTLIRRVTYDLTGLPPTPAEVDSFLRDQTPEAFSRVVDRLLASPRYGERWGRHWLDVVRYTDSFDARFTGQEIDSTEAHRYRDWVVSALNRDLPYDQFVRMQIAGDLMPGPGPSGFNREGIIATGVMAIGEWGTGDADKEKMLTDIVDDQIDVVGRAFLGITLACARCHDHKFDPILTEDYYALAGIFFSSHILKELGAKTNASPLNRIPLLSKEELEAREKAEKRIQELQARIAELQARRSSELAGKFEQLDRYLLAALEWKKGNEPVSRFARSRGLVPFILQQWIELTGTTNGQWMLRSVAGYQNKPSLYLWKSSQGDTPFLAANTAPETAQFLSITMPGQSLAVHPAPASGVGVAWRSPMNGTIRVSAMLQDGDATCGNGIEWQIRRRGPSGTRTLATGVIPNGGRASIGADSFPALQAVEMHPGDRIELVVLPNKDYSCDTTILDLSIELPGRNEPWNLTREVLTRIKKSEFSNPQPDLAGNPDAWEFLDFAEPSIPDLGPLFTACRTSEDGLASAKAAESLKELAVKNEAAIQAILQDPKRAVPPEWQQGDGAFLKLLASDKSPFRAPAPLDAADFNAPERALIAEATTELANLLSIPRPPLEFAHGLAENGCPKSSHEGISDVAIHIRGRYDRLGKVVPRHFPTLLAGDQQPSIKQGSGRRELAEWLASRDNPMTARVMANRIWQQHFGEGIVRSPNNFGKLGTPPTHPELLDYLAVRFIESGWSMKALHRMILLSATYQQSSVPDANTLTQDPDNVLWGRTNRRRVEAEALRDSLLAAAGDLDLKMGGPAVKELDSPRRTVYLGTVRSDRANFRALFDAPDPTGIAEKRINSTVAPQALFMMNNPFALKQARRLSERVLKIEGDRIGWLYQNLYGRQPAPEERAVAAKMIPDPARASGETWEAYCQVLLCSNEFVYID